MAKLPGIDLREALADRPAIDATTVGRGGRTLSESFVDANVQWNRGRFFIGGGNTASFQAITAGGAPSGMQLDFYPSNDGYSIAAGKSALASLTSAAMMSADVDVSGIQWVVWEFTAASSAACRLNLELVVKVTG